MKPLAPERFALQVTISQETRAKLERAQALMRHRNPSGDLAEVIDSALDTLLASLEKQKFGATSRPRARRARTEEADPAYVSRDVRRQVHQRDGEQCTFVSADGVRCTARGFLEFDHRTPKSRGGLPTVGGTRLLCRVHNQYEAERILGAEFMREKRARAAAARAASGVEPERGTAAPPAAGGVEPERATAARVGGVEPERTAAARAASGGELERAAAARAPDIEHELSLALRGLGFKAPEIRRAIAETTNAPAATLEQRLRAALAMLTRSRCSDGPLEATRTYAEQGLFLACG